MAPLQLIIGNKNLSSWSLRPWLAMSQAGIDFEEILVPFHLPDWAERVRAHSPTLKVPVLRHGDVCVWESMAICEYLAELFPDAKLWPEAPAARALARAVSAEMHAGFADLRRECPMDITLRAPGRQLSARAEADVARVVSLWRDCRAQFGDGGPLLFGRFTIADAMFAPVVTRFITYSLAVDEEAQRYMRAVLELPAMKRWIAAAEVEPGMPARDVGDAGGAPAEPVRTRGQAERFAREWTAAWSRRDVEAVLSHYTDDALFLSPKAQTITGSSVVQGKAALRAYWTAALAKITDIRFDLDDFVWDPEAQRLLIRYDAHLNGQPTRATEIMDFDGDGRVTRGEAFYGGAATRVTR